MNWPLGEMWVGKRPPNHQSQIVNGETAVSGVETAVFGNEVGANGRPIVSRQVGVGWGKEEVGRITAVINYKRGRRGGTPTAAQ
jgi:hypothetical protein